MKPYIAMIRNDIRLALRQRVVIFFNYFMPLVFFLIFAQAFHADQGGVIMQVVAMVTVIGILGNGLMGAGIRAAQERETNVLRRFTISSERPARTLVEIVKWLDAQGLELDDVRLSRPTLEDVFIELTGKRLRE